MKARLAAMLLAAFAPIAWGSNVVASRYIVAHGVDPASLTALRWLLASSMMLAYSLARGIPVPLGWRLAAAGLLGITVFSNMLYLAVRYAPAALVGLVFGLLPVVTMLVSSLAYRIERIDGYTLAAAALGFAGVALIEAAEYRGGTGKAWLGVAIALASLLVWAVYTVESKKLTAGLHPLAALAGSTLASVPANLAVAAPWLPEALPRLGDPLILSLLVYLAAVPGFLAYLAWFSAVKELGPTMTSIFVNLMPVATLLLAVALLGERLTGTQALGAALVITSLALAARRQAMLAARTPSLGETRSQG